MAISLPDLQSLQLDNCGNLLEVTLHCPKLTRLSLAACWKLSAEAILTAIKGCPRLTHIDVRLCPGNVDIQALCARMKRMHSGALEIAFSPLKKQESVF